MTRRVLAVVLCALAAGVAMNSIAAVLLWNGQQAQVTANCASINRVVDAGVRILDTPANLKRTYDRGLITKAQYDQALRQVLTFDPLRQQNIADWRAGQCTSP